VRNPIISSVVYLSSAPATSSGGGKPGGGSSKPGSAGGPAFVGGPTLVTDQRLGGPLASAGWLAFPAVGRVTFFDGRFLHGGLGGLELGEQALSCALCGLPVHVGRICAPNAVPRLAISTGPVARFPPPAPRRHPRPRPQP
jgi:hypothetical protein